MAEQLTFDLPVRTALGRDAFFVSPANELAVRRLDGWRSWPEGRLILVGPKGAGKTHLAHVWAAQSGARIVGVKALSEATAGAWAKHPALVLEDANRVAGEADKEAALFHLYNLIGAAGGSLMLSATEPPAQWQVDLPDLKSRLLAMDIVRLQPPDDALLAALLVKLFADRQIAVEAELVPYLIRRMDRSAAAAQTLVNALDKAALAQKRPLTRRLAGEVLAAL